MFSTFVLTICLAQAGQSSPQILLDLPEGSSLKPVAVFRRDATFVAKDRQVRFLDLRKPGEPKAVFRVTWIADLNCQIALAKESQNVIATDGNAIYRVSETGASAKLATLKDVRVTRLDEVGAVTSGAAGSIVWFFATSTSRRFLYFALLLDGRQELCSLDLDSKEMKTIRVPKGNGVDVDRDTGVVYVPAEPGTRQIIVKDFHGTPEMRIPITLDCDRCQLSPDKKRLLLSNNDLDPHPRMALIELSTGKETVLPGEGSFAVWGTDEMLYFVRGSNSLWRYPLGAVNPTEVMTVRGRAARGYAAGPHLSHDKTWLAWCWAVEPARDPETGTILFDLKGNEYRQLDGWWDNVQWLPAASPAGKEE